MASISLFGSSDPIFKRTNDRKQSTKSMMQNTEMVYLPAPINMRCFRMMSEAWYSKDPMLSLPHQSYKCVTKLISPLINGVLGPYLKLVTLCPLSLGIQLYSQMMIGWSNYLGIVSRFHKTILWRWARIPRKSYVHVINIDVVQTANV